LGNTLEELVGKSIYIIREVKAQFKNPAVLWSTGKDSTTCLNLIREAFYGEVPWPVIHLDTGFKFREIYEFRDRLAEEWSLNLIVAKSRYYGMVSPKTHSCMECCTLLKTEALKKAIREYGFDSIIVSIRRDEHALRSMERYFSPRDEDFGWRVVRVQEKPTGDSGLEALQPVELSGWNLYESDFGPECQHVRVHPLLHWTEIDVWRYVKDRRLPYNPLYRADYVEKAYGVRGRRYRSLGCKFCTVPVMSKASTIDEIIEEIRETRIAERDGRRQDKETAYVMQKLRALGYM